MDEQKMDEQSVEEKGNFTTYIPKSNMTIDLESPDMRSMKRDFINVGKTMLEYLLWMFVFSFLFSFLAIPAMIDDPVLDPTKFLQITMLISVPATLLSGIVTIYRGRGKLQVFKKDFGLKNPWKWSMILKYAVIAIGLSTLAGLFIGFINFLLSFIGVQFITPDIAIGNDMIINITTAITVLVLAPIFEELLCRGLILKTLLRYDTRFAIVASSLMFALLHGNLIQGLPAFVMGLVLAYVFVKSESIIPCILLHFLNNLLALGGNYLMESYAVMEITLGVIQILMALFAVYFILGHRKELKEDLVSDAKERHLYSIFFNRWSIIVVMVFMLFMTFSEFITIT